MINDLTCSCFKVIALLAVGLSSTMFCAEYLMAEHGERVEYANGFIKHGIAAPVAGSRGVVATVDGNDRPVILVWLQDYGGCAMLVIDALSGDTRIHRLPFPTSDAPFYVLLGSNNRVYTMFNSHFIEFDPVQDAFTHIERASDHSLRAFGMTESQGKIWMAYHDNTELASFDLQTRQLKNYGSITEEDWPTQMPRHIEQDDQGWIYVGVGNRESFIVAYHPETGKRRYPIGREHRREGSRGYVILGVDGQVYGSPNWGDDRTWFRLYNGEATQIEAAELPRTAPAPKGTQNRVHDRFPDNYTLNRIDVTDRWAEIGHPDGSTQRITFSYETAGSRIESLTLGPDGRLYGSTRHPLRVYNYDPATQTFQENGLSGQQGHWNDLVVQGGRIFGAEYSGGKLHVYDPTQPWDPGNSTDSNPREIMTAEPVINRPHAVMAHPDGRHVLVTGTPSYGRTGGGMIIYDTETDRWELLADDQLIRNQSTNALVALPDGTVVGGTTLRAGLGGKVRAEQAVLYYLDLQTRKVTWQEAIVPGAFQIQDMVLHDDGLIYGITTQVQFGGDQPRMFVFDPATREVVHLVSLERYGHAAGRQAPRMMAVGPDNQIYVLFRNWIMHIQPGTFRHRPIIRTPVEVSTGIAVHEGRLYFTHDAEVWSFDFPKP